MKGSKENHFDESISGKIRDISFPDDQVNRQAVLSAFARRSNTRWIWVPITIGALALIFGTYLFTRTDSVSAQHINEQSKSVVKLHKDVHGPDVRKTSYENPFATGQTPQVSSIRDHESDGATSLQVNSGSKNNYTPTYRARSNNQKSTIDYSSIQTSKIALDGNSTGFLLKEERSDRLQSVYIDPVDQIAINDITSDFFRNDINEIPLAKKRKALHFFIDISPFLTYQQIQPNENDNLVLNNFMSSSRLSTDRIGLKGIIGVEVPLGNRVSFFSGGTLQSWKLSFSFDSRDLDDISFEIDTDGSLSEGIAEDDDLSEPEVLDAISENLNSGDFIALNLENEVSNTSVYSRVWNVGLTTGLKYNIPGKHIRHEIIGALEFQHLINLNDLKPVLDRVQLRQNQLVLNLHYASIYDLTKRLSLKLSPVVSYMLLKNDPSQGILSVRPFAIGINGGVNYRIK